MRSDKAMTPDDPQRRSLLRGLLAAGCAMCLPVAAGCGRDDAGKQAPAPGGGESKPAMPPGTAVQPPAGGEGGGEAGGAAAGKMSQAEAQYQDHPKGEQNCAGCVQFIADSNTCKVVEGQISPQGWCKLWAKKPA